MSREEWINNKKRNFENPMSDILKGVIKPIFDKKNALEAEILMNWNKIFPSENFSKVIFKKISFPKANNELAKLFVATSPANALELSYQVEQILEKITLIFGYKAFDKIIISKI
jgi:hypothetical protein